VTIDQSAKALNMARDVMTLSDNLMLALEGLISLEAERSTAGITLASFDSAITNINATTKHASGADYQASLTSAAALKVWLDQNFHSTNFNKVRP
jgi:hypothetical protein